MEERYTILRKGLELEDRQFHLLGHFEFNSRASYEEVMGTVKPVFFPNGDDNLSHYSLAGSSGVSIKVDKEKWTLEAFLKECKISPSRIRLYVVYNPQVY